MSRTPKSGLRLRAAGPVRGEHSVPGDKSVSHRAVMLAAVARGRSVITGFATSEDCWSTVRCLRGLGADVTTDGTTLVVLGRGREGLVSPSAELDAGNSGTTIRLLAGLLAGLPVEVSITGDESLRRRPMERVAAPLRRMGADVRTRDGRPPVYVRGSSPLEPIVHEPETPSAQVKSAVLLAGLGASGTTRVVERVRTRDHSERLLRAFGAAVDVGPDGVTIEGPSELSATDVAVPGDFSSAAFLLALALLVPDSEVTACRVGLNPTRTRLLDVLAELGATIEVAAFQDGPEPVGDVRARLGRELGTADGRTLVLDGAFVAEVIDEVPILAVLASQSRGGVRFEGAGELRKKESDRIAAIAGNLRAMGVDAEETADGLFVPGPCRLRGATIDPHSDHRIAMAFACAAMAAEGESTILDPDVVGVSFPDFYDHLPEGAVVADL